jgi:type II secretory pathway pseudopilin PulG
LQSKIKSANSSGIESHRSHNQGNVVDADVDTKSKASGRDAIGSTKRRPVIEPIEDGLAGITEIRRDNEAARRDEQGAAPASAAAPLAVDETPVAGEAPAAEQAPAAEPAPVPAPTRHERAARGNRAMTFLLAVIAIVGTISAVIFALLLREMQTAAELNRQGIRLNQEALDVARDSAQRQLRAYASILEFKCGACGDNAGPDEVFVKAGNDGQTPALNVYSSIGWNAGDPACGAIGGGFAYTYSQARYFKSLRTFGKDARDLATFDLNREVVQQARATNRRLCVYGTVNYATVFNDLGERETRFCYWYSRGSERTPCEEQNDHN